MRRRLILECVDSLKMKSSLFARNRKLISKKLKKFLDICFRLCYDLIRVRNFNKGEIMFDLRNCQGDPDQKQTIDQTETIAWLRKAIADWDIERLGFAGRRRLEHRLREIESNSWQKNKDWILSLCLPWWARAWPFSLQPLSVCFLNGRNFKRNS